MPVYVLSPGQPCLRKLAPLATMTAPAAISEPSLSVMIFSPSRTSSFCTEAVRNSALKCSAWVRKASASPEPVPSSMPG